MTLRRTVLSAVTGAAVVVGLAVTAPPAGAAPSASSWQVSSPDGSLTSTASLTGGRLTLTTTRGGQQVVSASHLGVQTSAGDLSSNLSIVSTAQRAVHDSYTMLTGKQSTRTVDENELTLSVRNGSGQSMDVVVRVADEGSAFRYVVAGSGSWTVTGEPVTFSLPTTADSWLQSFVPWYENYYDPAPVTSAPAGDYGFPGLFRTGSTYTMLTESNVRGTYVGSHLSHASSGNADFGLAFYEGAPVQATGSLATPWRVQLTGTAAQVVDSTMVDDLADPQELSDTSWVKPGLSAWSWIAAGASTGAQGDLGLQEKYVDLAAKEGWRYSLADEGWNADWVPTLVRYGAAKGVGINLWFHSNQLWTDDQIASWFPRLHDWGVTGVKIDFIQNDSQEAFAWYEKIAQASAKYHLMVDFHGTTIPRGLQRTWPQIMTYEAVAGEEGGRDAGRDTILPFTRNVVGSMDYTPTIFTNNTDTTKAEELAKTVLFESGWQHPADSPEAYAAQPPAARFLANVPASWDDTRFVSGTPGGSAVVARRSGTSWFIGGVADAATTLDIPLSMLGGGQWLVTQVTDGPDGNLAQRTTQRTAASVLHIPVLQHGGVVMKACPATPGRVTCFDPVVPVTSTAVLVDARPTSVDTGSMVTVRGTFVVRTAGPAQDVTMDLQLPDTWTLVSGGPVTKDKVADGRSITGLWKVKVGPGGPRGSVDLVVAASFTTRGGRSIVSSDAATVQVAQIAPTGDAYLSDLPFLVAQTDYGQVMRDTDLSGGPITLGNDPTVYPKGVVANSNATVGVYLGGKCSSFTASVGITPDGDNPAGGTVTFQAFDGNGKALGSSVGTNAAPITVASGATPFSVSTVGVQQLVLKIGDAGDNNYNDHGAFADAVVHCAG